MKVRNDIIASNARYNGVGEESVYVYTFESLTKRQNKKKGMIKMKVGMTTQTDPLDRIKQQIGASGHEKIILFHIYKTHMGHFFEKTIHNKLKKMGRHLKKDVAVGTEWFWVSEKEINKLLHESNKEVNKIFPRNREVSSILSGPVSFVMVLSPLVVSYFQVEALIGPSLCIMLIAFVFGPRKES